MASRASGAGHFQTATALCWMALFVSSLCVCVYARGCACVVRVDGDGGGHSGTADGGEAEGRATVGTAGRRADGRRPATAAVFVCERVQGRPPTPSARCSAMQWRSDTRAGRRWQRNDESSAGRLSQRRDGRLSVGYRRSPTPAVCSHPAPAHCTTHTRADRAPHTDTPQRTATARAAAAAASAVSPVQPFPVTFPSRWTRVTSPCR